GGGGLVLALEPTTGLETMRERRGRESLLDLCRGPGRLGQALAIGPELDGEQIGAGRIALVPAPPAGLIVQTPRIGITRAVELPWRFLLADSPYVSSSRRSRSA